MEGPRDYHTKWSKLDRERQTYDIAYTWNLKKKKDTVNLFPKYKETHRHKKNKILVTTKERRVGEIN